MYACAQDCFCLFSSVQSRKQSWRFTRAQSAPLFCIFSYLHRSFFFQKWRTGVSFVYCSFIFYSPSSLILTGTFKQPFVPILNFSPHINYPIWHWLKMLLLVKGKVYHQIPGLWHSIHKVLNVIFDTCFYYSFVKTWKVANNGDDKWPEGSYLAFTGGVKLCMQNAVPVAPLNPGEVVDISVDMTSPSVPGTYESKWRMATPNGSYFGGQFMLMVFITWIIHTFLFCFVDKIGVILSVAEGGTLALTQQLAHFNALGSVMPPSSPYNPFAAQDVGRQHNF